MAKPGGPTGIERSLERVMEANNKRVELELPVAAVQLLYDVLGHFPYAVGSWATDARALCSGALYRAAK